MSSTRTAKDDSVFYQNRYASRPEFERGLMANLVAKRCALIDDKTDRELIWFVQFLSNQAGGLAALAKDLIVRYPDRIGTPTMLKSGKTKAQNYSAEEIRAIRFELPAKLRRRFPLYGETQHDLAELYHSKHERLHQSAERSRHLMAMADDAIYRSGMIDDNRQAELAEQDSRDQAAAKKQPSSYPVAALRELCYSAAMEGMPELECRNPHKLERELAEMCLNPEWQFEAVSPWYFADMLNVLRECQQQWIQEKSKVVVTALGKKVCDTLDYTLHSRSLSLVEGNARMGKSFSARAWCLQHPGKARFVEVPAGNDDATFYRTISRGLGLGNFLKYKSSEIRDKVESVLLTGDILLVLDEAQRLWPQGNYRYGFPGRITWVMAMANAGVPICMVSTPQFIMTQKVIEKTGWNSAQLTGRIGHYEFLPSELETSDLIAVSRAVLPEASEAVLKALAIYARTSARYLSAVDSIAKRAQYIALRSGRNDCSTEDVRTAMKESVIPSDTMLQRTLEIANKPSAKGRAISPIEPPREQIEPASSRNVRPLPQFQTSFSRRTESADLVQA